MTTSVSLLPPSGDNMERRWPCLSTWPSTPFRSFPGRARLLLELVSSSDIAVDASSLFGFIGRFLGPISHHQATYDCILFTLPRLAGFSPLISSAHGWERSPDRFAQDGFSSYRATSSLHYLWHFGAVLYCLRHASPKPHWYCLARHSLDILLLGGMDMARVWVGFCVW